MTFGFMGFWERYILFIRGGYGIVRNQFCTLVNCICIALPDSFIIGFKDFASIVI